MKRIFLLGYMGVGKTVVGKELAKALAVNFLDLDLFIQSRYHKTVAKIFEEHGQEAFRKVENSLLQEVCEFEDIVISVGGGTPCFFDNVDYMNHCGTTVYLKASPQILTERLLLAKESRPLIRDKKDTELYDFISSNLESREPFYKKAQITVDVDFFSELIQLNDLVFSIIDKLKLNTLTQ